MESSARRGDVCEGDILAVGGPDVLAITAGKEREIIDVIRKAYEAHHEKLTCLPHSTFLLFPRAPLNRIIALPAYLAGSINSAGVKWIASFPENVEQGLDRASAVLILNSIETGRPTAIMEGSIISAKRTAASAALAASILTEGSPSIAGIIGCGKINLEIARFLLVVHPGIETLLVYDIYHERSLRFREQCEKEFPAVETRDCTHIQEVLNGSSLISFATTAVRPHVASLECCLPEAVILHISLRDLTPKVILASDNIVDDSDHVCRAETSVHLAEQQVKHRGFIRCTLGDILDGCAPPRRVNCGPAIFSPFGLGILDIALAEYVLQQATSQSSGVLLKSFLPHSWQRISDKASLQSAR